MNWQVSSSRGEKRLTTSETAQPEPQTALDISLAGNCHDNLHNKGRGTRAVSRKRPRPSLGILLRGANLGADGLFLAQTAADGAGINVKQLSRPEPVAPCLLKDGADDRVMQILHTSA